MPSEYQQLDLSSVPSVVVVGCGGVGSHLIPSLYRLTGNARPFRAPMVAFDGDTLERGNLDRQLFPWSAIGKNKATAIAELFPGVVPHSEYFHDGTYLDRGSVIFCCADNHVARRNALAKTDEINGCCIVGGNEYTDADAYIYFPWMAGSPNDPRIWAPEIMTDNSGDPRRPIGCPGLVNQGVTQLVIANATAAIFMLRLFWWWYAEAPTLDRENINHWPVALQASASRVQTVLLGARLKK